MNKLFSAFIAIVFTFSLFSFTISAFAQNQNVTGLGVVPANQKEQNGLNRAWFIDTIEPGKTVTRTAEIINNFDREATIKVFAKDATQTLDGSFTFIENEDQNKEVGSWVKLSNEQVTLPAKKATQVSFTITIPADTKPGEYAGAIAVQETTNPNANQEGVQLQTRIGARIYITVPGSLSSGFEVKNMNLMTPQASKYSEFIQATKHLAAEKMYLNFDITNIGNIYSYAKGVATIEGPDGKTEVNIAKDLAPRSPAVNMLIDLNRNWKEGNYIITVELSSPAVVDTNKGDLAANKTEKATINFTFTKEMLEKMKADKASGSGQPLPTASNGGGFSVGQAAEVSTNQSSNNNLIIYILIGVILLLVGVFVGYVVYSNQKNKSKGK